eukprot:SAG31_NODE_14883_length_782_cov_1.035139_2_plen_24_part_01
MVILLGTLSKSSTGQATGVLTVLE